MVLFKIKPNEIYKIELEIAMHEGTKTEFAKKIGVSLSYLSRVLSGKVNVGPKVAIKIANGLGKSVDMIFHEVRKRS